MILKTNIISMALPLLLMTGTVKAGNQKSEDVAAKAAATLKSKLMAALGKALEQGGVTEAIQVCSRDAMELTREAGKVDPAVLSIDRRTDRWRNPKNKADEGDRKAIGAFRENPKLTQITQQESEGVLRYYQPLRINAACLQCHGKPEAFPPEVRKLLKETYPMDRATGYKVGDLRGVIRVRVSK